MKKIVILISGRGSNMEAILRAHQNGMFQNAEIALVLSDKENAPGLKIAKEWGISTDFINPKGFLNRAEFDEALAQKIEYFSPSAVVLAGFMRILGEDFVRQFENRLINIHPSLLPSFTGLDTHARAIETGVKIHGCTVHFVTPQLDCGPIILQAAVPVYENDTPESLGARVLKEEHKILPQALAWLLEGKLTINGLKVEIKDGEGSVFPR